MNGFPMFCHQFQETAGNKGCSGKRGVCGKTSETANLQDLLIWTLKGISAYLEHGCRIKKMPEDAVILTAGCAKYRYNKLGLKDIDGIPRVLDAGQCNDSYSIAAAAMELQKAFGFSDINKLPISFDLAWHEPKAVLVLLSLLYLGSRGIRLGPTLPGFLSPDTAKMLAGKFDIRPAADSASDVSAMMSGE